MNSQKFRTHAHKFVDWMADYMDNVQRYPVKSQVRPGEIYAQIRDDMPATGESIEAIFADFKEKILPGITHWQSPNYFAYFNANASPPSILAEMLTATLAVQGMKWETSPASTELEERMMEWLRNAMGLPHSWKGVIHDTASTATLVAILTAREKVCNFKINKNGFTGNTTYRVYCSAETHSSIEKGVKIAGIGSENVVKIPVDNMLAMQPDLLEEQIVKDRSNGCTPLCIVPSIGTTGTLAIDPLLEIADIGERHKVWLHIDAAYVGSALLCPEYQSLITGIEKADSFVFNPHKWLNTNFDCSAYFVKDAEALVNTFAILPEYLKTKTDGQVSNHCDWGIQLGRRFRALKLWFVMRYYGLEGLQNKLRTDIGNAEWLASQIREHPNFEMVVPRQLNLVCFRFHIPEKSSKSLNQMNETLLHQLNATGKLYLTHTKVRDQFTLRMCIGQTNTKKQHVEQAWDLIKQHGGQIRNL